MKAAEICARASELTGGDREQQHGPKRANFDNVAGHWNWWLSARGLLKPGVMLTAVDVAHMMAGHKQARTLTGDFNFDDLIDAAGYLACAGELQSE